MASGQVCVRVIKAMPPATLFAQLDSRAGAATPAESVEVFDFDAATREYMDFLCELLPNYAGGGLTLTIAWSATSATSGKVCWTAAIRAFPDDAEDLDSTAHSYDYNAANGGAGVTAPSAAGEVVYDAITFTHGADMDSWAVGELAIVRISRDAANANDDMSGDAELWAFSVKET